MKKKIYINTKKRSGMMNEHVLVHLFETPSQVNQEGGLPRKSYHYEGPSSVDLCFSSETVLWLVRLVQLRG